MNSNFELAPAEWATLRRLLDDALDLPLTERGTWVEQLDAEFDAFKPRLRTLLALAARGAGALPLDSLPRIETAQFLADRRTEADGLYAGGSVGPYRLIRLLGEGGMGEVWLAERTEMLHKRQVALKVPRLLTGRTALAERLAREREILAGLNHPNIARLYDAGIDSDGQPYLALEYVDGERIDAYCTRNQLDVRARLRLFLQAAHAVAHAHANLVVHRDLKPTNILVTGAGDVKLLDFGIAKLLEDGRAQETELTQLAGRALTPDYAAPEQILGQPIGTAADVYALGVVLFELLTGERPYKLRHDSRAALEEAIVQTEPARPSAAVSDPSTRKALRGDIDTIVLKALKKQPADRYGTVDAFAEDIERHLEQRPVRAQPDSRWYRSQRFVARNRVAVVGASGVLIAIIVGAGLSVWQARVALAERERADVVKNFIAGLFRDANPFLGGGRKMTVDELLLQSKPKIDAQFAARPDIRAELLLVVGTNLGALGEDKAAAPIIAEAESLAISALGDDHPISLHARTLVLSRRYFTDPGSALAADSDRLLSSMRSNPAVDPAYLVVALAARAQLELREGRPAAAVPLAEEALRVANEKIGPQAEQTLGTSIVLALAHQRLGQWDQALLATERLMRLVFDVRKFDSGHPSAVDARLMHGMALADAGRLDEGLKQLEQGVVHALERRSPTDSAIGSYRAHLARYQLRAGRIDEALSNFEQAATILRAAAGENNRRFAQATLDLGGALLVAQRPDAALERLQAAQQYFGAAASDTLAEAAKARLAVALAWQGRLEEAALQLGLDDVAPAPASAAGWEVSHAGGWVLRVRDRPADALAWQRSALAALPAATPAVRVDRARVLTEIALVQLALQHDESAEESANEAVALLRTAQLQTSPWLADALVAQGRARLALDRAVDACVALDEAHTFWSGYAPSSRAAGEATYWLGRCLSTLGQADAARTAYAQAAVSLQSSRLPGDAQLLVDARQRR
jgi:serine/threonine protein kinase/tetratricopeptide (TPR) repeat protein